MPVKIDPDIVSELESMGLVLWDARYAKTVRLNPKSGKATSCEDRSLVLVSLNGPGVDRETFGRGSDLKSAVDDALLSGLADRVPGLKGAMMRLGFELRSLEYGLRARRFKLRQPIEYQDEGYYDDDIPF